METDVNDGKLMYIAKKTRNMKENKEQKHRNTAKIVPHVPAALALKVFGLDPYRPGEKTLVKGRS